MQELIGKNIKLRRYKLSDANDIYQNVKDKEIVKWTKNIPHPYSKNHAIKFIRQSEYNLKKKKGYNFGIVLKETNRVIGNISFKKTDWKNKRAELGYWLGKKYWKKGYMTEAVKLILDYGFKKLKLHSVCADVFKENIASKRVLEKSRFKLEGEMREITFRYNKWQNYLKYCILESEFH